MMFANERPRTPIIDDDDTHFDVTNCIYGAPEPWEILPHGGIPGFEYIYASAHRVAHYQRSGWARVEGLPDLTFTGKKGSCPVVVMCKGDRIPGAAQGVHRCKWYVDPEVDERTGNPLANVPSRKATPEATERAHSNTQPVGRPPKPSAPASESKSASGAR